MSKSLSEILFEEGEERGKYYNAVSPPLIQTSNFVFSTVEQMRLALSNEYDYSVYSRGNNPTLAILRHKIAELEGAEDALVFSSGCGAIAAALFSQLRTGDHLVCIRKPYTWVSHFCKVILPKYGITTTFVEEGSAQAYEAACQSNTKLFYLESPNTFTFEITDIRAVAEVARSKGIKTIIDNSYSTPLYQSPLSLGVDLVLHSASKYLSGHSDVVAGVLAGNKEMIRKIYDSEYLAFGAVLPPFEAWLMLRGLRTLEIRLQRSTANAKALIKAIDNHPRIKRIFYPFHAQHPKNDIARSQMKDCSGLFSIELNVDTPDEVILFCNNLKHFLKAVSWGGFESLVDPAITVYDFEHPEANELSWRIVRFYCGLESSEILIDDVLQALNILDNGAKNQQK